MERQVVAVDLFCGLGGLTHGLASKEIDVRVGVDIDPACRFPYVRNNAARFVERDVRELSADDLAAWFDDASIRLLAGCAPCQPFSTYSRSHREERGGSDWSLLREFGRLVHEVRPELVTMENVPQLPTHPVYQEFLEAFEGYDVWANPVACSAFGVPQRRKRFVLVASRLGPISLISPEQANYQDRSVRSTIGHLPPLTAGEVDRGDPLHRSSRLSDLNLKRIRASRPGGTWRDWPTELRATCHLRESGKDFGSVYGRMSWDEPAPTMTTLCFGYGNGRFGHPEQDRAISLREAALLQTFPPGYRFVADDAPVRFNVLGRLIGNAVPVRLGEVIGRTFIAHLDSLSHTAAKEASSHHHH